jgi:hypothetical protein
LRRRRINSPAASLLFYLIQQLVDNFVKPDPRSPTDAPLGIIEPSARQPL